MKDPESMQHIHLKRTTNKPTKYWKEKVPEINNMKKHQPKKEYSLRSKHNIKTATVSEVSHLGERLQQVMKKGY